MVRRPGSVPSLLRHDKSHLTGHVACVRACSCARGGTDIPEPDYKTEFDEAWDALKLPSIHMSPIGSRRLMAAMEFATSSSPKRSRPHSRAEPWSRSPSRGSSRDGMSDGAKERMRARRDYGVEVGKAVRGTVMCPESLVRRKGKAMECMMTVRADTPVEVMWWSATAVESGLEIFQGAHGLLQECITVWIEKNFEDIKLQSVRSTQWSCYKVRRWRGVQLLGSAQGGGGGAWEQWKRAEVDADAGVGGAEEHPQAAGAAVTRCGATRWRAGAGTKVSVYMTVECEVTYPYESVCDCVSCVVCAHCPLN